MRRGIPSTRFSPPAFLSVFALRYFLHQKNVPGWTWLQQFCFASTEDGFITSLSALCKHFYFVVWIGLGLQCNLLSDFTSQTLPHVRPWRLFGWWWVYLYQESLYFARNKFYLHASHLLKAFCSISSSCCNISACHLRYFTWTTHFQERKNRSLRWLGSTPLSAFDWNVDSFSKLISVKLCEPAWQRGTDYCMVGPFSWQVVFGRVANWVGMRILTSKKKSIIFWRRF